jgi:hypothetical protein
MTTKRNSIIISVPECIAIRLGTYAGMATAPILFGAFSSKLAIESVLQGSSWPFVNKTWVGFMFHP